MLRLQRFGEPCSVKMNNCGDKGTQCFDGICKCAIGYIYNLFAEECEPKNAASTRHPILTHSGPMLIAVTAPPTKQPTTESPYIIDIPTVSLPPTPVTTPAPTPKMVEQKPTSPPIVVMPPGEYPTIAPPPPTPKLETFTIHLPNAQTVGILSPVTFSYNPLTQSNAQTRTTTIPIISSTRPPTLPPTRPSTLPPTTTPRTLPPTTTTQKPTTLQARTRPPIQQPLPLPPRPMQPMTPQQMVNPPLSLPPTRQTKKFLSLGSKCHPGDQCPENADCIQKICVCMPGKILKYDKCLNPDDPLATGTTPRPTLPTTPAFVQRSVVRHIVHETCDDVDDCIKGASCIRGICECPPNTVEKEDKCVRTALSHGVAEPGDSCEHGEICAGGSMCDWNTKRCICAAGHDGSQGYCVRDDVFLVLPGGRCRNAEARCVAGSSCVNERCACAHDHEAVDGYCRPVSAPNANVEYIPNTGLRFRSHPNRAKTRAFRCQPENCKLPACFCSHDGRQVPNDLDPRSIPQFVVLTFDDAVNGKTAPEYKHLLSGAKAPRNPNGCPAKATIFVSHEWTNYDEVQWLADQGHELASNSITHANLQGASATRWLNEMDGERRILAKFGNVPEESIVGIRAPQLAPGGDEMFEMMQRGGFLYDNSISANPGSKGEPYWPQTMDFKAAWACAEKDCPKSSYPGIWSIPLNQIRGSYLPQIQTHKRATMLRAAVELNSSVSDLVQVLKTNFNASYSTNRAPFILSLNSDYLNLGNGNGIAALEVFLTELQSMKDVYFITLKSLVSWMQDPKTLDKIDQFPDLNCDSRVVERTLASPATSCAKPNKCIFPTPMLGSSEHQFLTCNPCPHMYPWLDNPTGVSDM